MDALPDYVELRRIHAALAGKRVVAVSSALPGEGVTTLAIALATRAARAGMKTLLVDLNLHRPAVADRMGLPRTPWHRDPVAATPAAVASCGFDVLGAPLTDGAGAPSTSLELLDVAEALNGWSARYDRIVVDASPLTVRNRGLLPADLVAASVDAVVLAVMAGRTRLTQVDAALGLLKRVGAPIAGIVMNDRDNPSLRAEILREIQRLDRLVPGLSPRIRRWVNQQPWFKLLERILPARPSKI